MDHRSISSTNLSTPHWPFWHSRWGFELGGQQWSLLGWNLWLWNSRRFSQTTNWIEGTWFFQARLLLLPSGWIPPRTSNRAWWMKYPHLRFNPASEGIPCQYSRGVLIHTWTRFLALIIIILCQSVWRMLRKRYAPKSNLIGFKNAKLVDCGSLGSDSNVDLRN
jgi:hypothetical protein